MREQAELQSQTVVLDAEVIPPENCDPLSILAAHSTISCPQKTTNKTHKTRENRPFHHAGKFPPRYPD
jgi:hypothetical protein